MSIWDGFKLWLGKALADVAIFFGILLLIALAFGLLLAYVWVADWWAKWKAKHDVPTRGSEP